MFECQYCHFNYMADLQYYITFFVYLQIMLRMLPPYCGFKIIFLWWKTRIRRAIALINSNRFLTLHFQTYTIVNLFLCSHIVLSSKLRLYYRDSLRRTALEIWSLMIVFTAAIIWNIGLVSNNIVFFMWAAMPTL